MLETQGSGILTVCSEPAPVKQKDALVCLCYDAKELDQLGVDLLTLKEGLARHAGIPEDDVRSWSKAVVPALNLVIVLTPGILTVPAIVVEIVRAVQQRINVVLLEVSFDFDAASRYVANLSKEYTKDEIAVLKQAGFSVADVRDALDRVLDNISVSWDSDRALNDVVMRLRGNKRKRQDAEQGDELDTAFEFHVDNMQPDAATSRKIKRREEEAQECGNRDTEELGDSIKFYETLNRLPDTMSKTLSTLPDNMFCYYRYYQNMIDID